MTRQARIGTTIGGKLLTAGWLTLAVSSSWAINGCADEKRRSVPRLPAKGAVEVIATGVADGDTFVATIHGAPRRVRLARIDAPEKRQPYGRRAEQALRELVWKRTVHMHWEALDRNCRPIAQVRVEGSDVGEALVRMGMAWQYTGYSQDPGLAALEQRARDSRSGLWADPNPIPPWQWRREQRAP
jgi:micrococcal nuclease